MKILSELGLPAKLATIQNARDALHVDHLTDQRIEFSLTDRADPDRQQSITLAMDGLGLAQLQLDRLPVAVAKRSLSLLCRHSNLMRIRIDADQQALVEPLAAFGFARDCALVDSNELWAIWVRSRATPSTAPDASEQLQLAGQCRRKLGMDPDPRDLEFCTECPILVSVGEDRFGRPQRMHSQAAMAWQAMQSAAANEAPLQLVSAYRGMRYQTALLQRKLETGQSVEQLMTINAPPGFSQHHTGCALDLAAPDQEALTESFENTAQFAWLQANAGQFGFHLSYPRDNEWGFAYEPWHWAWQGNDAA
ncbi:MAG: hypothetical protein DHS20C11_07670 [Lysobacteraceae bacterium]|nr:MAG: hypothetical protein DHS20C11_07670 [Xanthomonadaceae bacterium]